MDDPSMTKVTEQDKAQKVKVKDLLEKLKAKKQLKEERRDDDYTSLNPNPGPSTETNIYNRHETKAQRDLANVEKHVNRCRTMISDVKGLFDGHPALSLPREQAWSLMNAVLDHGNVLPTSGLRACTAVVVEVDQNTTSNSFEADIELLQSREWFDELQILLKELQDDTNKKNDASASYCKVKAVYGRIGSFEILSEITDVTNMLGSIIHIQENDPEEFRLQIEKYIANLDSRTGGQYWPIVKHVRLRMPHCDVCSSGTTLVDLPGVRDSNAARDKIAKNYLKNCTAVWVVSSIHRAIDDKTAKDLLGENFRRQLLMDGQYGSIAFICTKTDVITPSEIIRSLNLNEKTKEYEENVKNMENMKTAVVKEIANVNNVLRGLRKSIEDQKNEARELKDTLANIDSLLEPAEGEQVQNEELEIIQEYKEELKTKDALIRENEDREQELLQQQKEACEKKTSLEKTISQERNKIVAICALARNDYSSSHIKRDFKDGLREMKRQNGMLNTEDPEEEEDLYVDDSDDDDGSTTNNLRVFCCSSTEYQKMKNLPAYDGPPQVFSNLTDTQIPALRNYVHEMTYNRQRQSLERLIHNLGRLVFDMHIYASERLNMIERGVQAAGSAIEDELERLDTDLGNALQKLTADIDDIFDGSLRPKIEKGASSAYEEANNTCAKWGAPAIRDRTTDRREGGLSCKTYIATTRRNGVYYSPTFGPVDFNEDLAAPMYRSMAIVWDTAFSEMLWRLMDQLHADIVARILDFNDRLQKQLELLGISAMRTDRLATQANCSANNKLTEMVSNLKDVVTPWQREISRIVTPHIQTMMLDEYGQCAADSGKDVFVRMKTYMAQGIDSKRGSMFDEAKQMLMEQLMKLRDVKSVKDILITDLRRGFEPLWEAPSKSLVARQAFAKVLDEFTVKMRVIYQEAGIQNTEDGHKLPAPRRGHSGGAAQGSSSVTTVARVQGDSTVARQPEWPTYTATIHKMEDTSYDTASTEAPLMAIGQQTLNDVYQDTLEDSQAAVSLLPKIEPDETATFSEPPAKTPSQQVSSTSSTRTIQSTNMNCSQPARIGEKGKGPGKSKGNMNSPLLSQTTTPKQTIPTSTVVTEPQDRPIQTTPTVTVKAEPTNTGYKE
ncbi:SLIP-like protein, partial [Mya arenaria]